jgi:hypothetical protein
MMSTATNVLTQVALGLGHKTLNLEALIEIRGSIERYGWGETCGQAGEPCTAPELRAAWLEWSAMATEMFAPVNRGTE